MEKKSVTIDSNYRFFALRDAQLFDWKNVKEETKGDKIILSFEREENVPYALKRKALEKDYHRISSIPMWLLILFALFAIGFITLYLINMLVKDNFNQTLWICVALVPGVLCGMILALLAVIYTKQSLKYANSVEERYNIYQEKMKALKHEED